MTKLTVVLLILSSSMYAHTVTVSWHASTTPGVTYSVYRLANGNYVRRVSGIKALTWPDNGVTPGVTYSYVVRSVIKVNGVLTESPNSNVATVTVPKTKAETTSAPSNTLSNALTRFFTKIFDFLKKLVGK